MPIPVVVPFDTSALEVLRRPVESTQYTSLVYGAYAKTSGIALSMGRVGDPWDNAVAETFFASLEKELLRRERFPTREAARMRLFWYIECFYNTRRRHSSLGYLAPAEYEAPRQPLRALRARRPRPASFGGSAGRGRNPRPSGHRGLTTRCQPERVNSNSNSNSSSRDLAPNGLEPLESLVWLRWGVA